LSDFAHAGVIVHHNLSASPRVPHTVQHIDLLSTRYCLGTYWNFDVGLVDWRIVAAGGLVRKTLEPRIVRPKATRMFTWKLAAVASSGFRRLRRRRCSKRQAARQDKGSLHDLFKIAR
jgi:hypothetical protein